MPVARQRKTALVLRTEILVALLVKHRAQQDRRNACTRVWRLNNKEHVKAYESEYSRKNATHKNALKRERDRKNRKAVNARKRAWEANNVDKCRMMRARYRNNRYHRDPAYALVKRMKALLGHVLKGKAGRRTQDLIGCDKNFFAKWMESQFVDGMSFGNRRSWAIDHVFPTGCCGGNEDQVLLAQNYKNLRPMWRHDNHVKTSKLTEESIVAAFLCGITEIHVLNPWQATEELLTSAERIGFKVFRKYENENSLAA